LVAGIYGCRGPLTRQDPAARVCRLDELILFRALMSKDAGGFARKSHSLVARQQSARRSTLQRYGLIWSKSEAGNVGPFAGEVVDLVRINDWAPSAEMQTVKKLTLLI
jgi:hypothetical protein